MAIGTRLARGAHVVRGPKRELISRAYNLLLKLSLRGRFSDAQCGFKALRRESALQLLPLVEDDEWFFDTELLVTAERLGLRISEVPVDWVDDPDSRVKIVRTALSDLRGVWRISHGQARRLTHRNAGAPVPAIDQVAADQLLRFAGVGAISTLGYLFLFIAWRPVAGTFGANALALAICTLFNTAVHRELAYNMQGSGHRGRFAGVTAGLFRHQPGPDLPGARGRPRHFGHLPADRTDRSDGGQRRRRCPSLRHPAGLGLPAHRRHRHRHAGEISMTNLLPPTAERAAAVGLLDPPVGVPEESGLIRRPSLSRGPDRGEAWIRVPLRPGSRERCGLGPPRPPDAPHPHRRALPLGPRGLGLGQLLLFGGRAGGH